MADNAPSVRPLTISERSRATIYGMIPSSLMLMALKAILIYISGPDLTGWEIVRYSAGFTGGLDDVHVDIIDTFYVPYVLSKGTYGVFYFTWGRSLGHMVVSAHVVDARTGRPMQTWQKAVRTGLQVINGYVELLRLLDLLSVVLVLVDTERRRSLYDLVANTVVIVGDPVAEEPEPEPAGQRSPLSAWLDRLTGRAPTD